MAYKGFLVKLIFLLHLMGVSHLCSSALADSWRMTGAAGGAAVSVCVQEQDLENALACDLSHYSSKSEATVGTGAAAPIACHVLAGSPRIWVSGPEAGVWSRFLAAESSVFS